jgi:hypothetical protein
LIAAGTLVVYGARGLEAPLQRDAGLYLYAGQQVASGDAPYVAVLNRAGPIAHLLPALGVELGRLIGTGDVVGVKILYLLLVSAAPALVYLIGRDVFGSRLAGVTAAAALLSVHVLAVSATNGPEAKLPVMVAALVALLLLVRRRWLWAGVATAIATLTWQPALFLLLPAAAVLGLTRPETWAVRVRDLLWFAVGGLAALAVTIFAFWAAGALAEFVEGFWTVNASHTQQTGLLAKPTKILGFLQTGLGWTLYPMIIGTALMVLLGVVAIGSRRTERRAPDRMALGAGTAAFFIWCCIAFNRAPDGLPLYPLAALGLGGAVGALAHWVRRAQGPLPRRVLIGAVACWVSVCLALTLMHTVSHRTDDIEYQQQLTDIVFDNLPDDVTVFTYEATPPMVLSRSESISRYVLFDHGMLSYIGDEWPGGVDGYVHWLMDEGPDVVFIHTRNPWTFLLPLLANYDRVSGGPHLRGNPEWRAFVRHGTDPDVVAKIKKEYAAARRAHEAAG